jgi:HrpA-like RNA helicase
MRDYRRSNSTLAVFHLQALEESDNAHGPSEDALAEKWVTEALRLLREREQQESEKRRRKKDGGAAAAAAEGSVRVAPGAAAEAGQTEAGVVASERPAAGGRAKGPTIRESYAAAAATRRDETADYPEADEAETAPDAAGGAGEPPIYFEETVDSPGEPVEPVYCSLQNDSGVNAQLTQDARRRRESKKYTEMLTKRRNLPAFQMASEVIAAILRNRVTVVSGDTGCGEC